MTTNDSRRVEAMDPKEKRALLARLLQERASGRGVTFPLSSGQEALWFLYRLAPESPAYNIAFCVRIVSGIDRKRLETAVKGLIARHPVLRSTFIATDEGVHQQVSAIPDTGVELVDAARWDEGELEERVREAYARPFDLERGPVFRAALFQRGDGRHILLLVVHHIVFDAWSMGLVLSDLASLYDGKPLGPHHGPPAGYADFVRWQRAWLEAPEGRESLAYWRNRLKGPLPVLDLPADRARPSVASFRGATHHFELSQELCVGVRGLACAESATPFMVIGAVFQALLYRYTGQPDVILGTPMAGRSRSEFEKVVGYFVNPVVLREPIAPGSSLRVHIAKMRETVLGALTNGDFPYFELVKQLQPDRERSRTPVFQTMFNLVKTSQIGVDGDVTSGRIRVGELELEPYPLDQQQGQFDLSLTLLDTGGRMPATFKYSSDLFDAARIERMAGHFRTLLSAAVADPERAIAELPLLTPREERAILFEWNGTETDDPRDRTLHGLLEAQVDRAPDAPAIVTEEGEISYRELEIRANRIAHRLRKLGAGAGTLVGICLDRSVDLVAGMLGILKAGAAYVPIDGSYPRERIGYMIDDSRIAVLLTERRFEKDIAPGGAAVVLLDADPSLAAEDSARPGCDATPESLAYVIYTSGSTGRPKGAMIHHGAIANHLLWMQRTWPLSRDDVVLQKTSTSFDPSVWEIWGPLLAGARVVMARPGTQGDPAYLVSAVIRHRVTHLRLVPSVLELVVREPEFGRCASLRRLFVGGEALSRALVERVWQRLDVEVANLYGPTEATIVSVAWVVERGPGPYPPMVPIGRPISNLRAYVLDGTMRPVPVGVPGELYLGGAGVGRGYLRRPELTEERFLDDPFVSGGRLYKTGDVCRLRGDGVIEFLGRNDHQVKIRGCRIELGEVEAALREHADVAQAMVVAREAAPGDVRLAAYLVARPAAAPDQAALRSFLRDRLPEYMVPSSFAVLPSLPLSASGKVDRKALPLSAADGPGVGEYEAPRTATETTVAGIFADVLKVGRVGIRDDFFALGGHSLLATQLLSRVRTALGVDLPVRALFDAPTLAALCEAVEAERARPGAGAGARATVIPRVSREARRVRPGNPGSGGNDVDRGGQR